MNDNLQHSAGARRISWVDYGKGLAILLVFWGHAICPEPVRASFYAFHIPVFYFLSGYVFSTRKYHSFGPFLWHKVRTLIIPGLTFGFLIVFFKWLNGLIAGEAYSVNPLKLLIGVFVELRGGDYSVIPWFFVSIFIIELMAYWIFGLAKEHAGVLLSLALIASVVGYCYATFIGKIVPWSLETACTGFGFFVLGYLAKSPGKNLVCLDHPTGMVAAMVGSNGCRHVVECNYCPSASRRVYERVWMVSVHHDGRVGRHRVGVGVVAVAGIPRADRCRQASEFTVAIHRQKFVHLLQSEPSGIAYRRRDPGSLRYSSQ